MTRYTLTSAEKRAISKRRVSQAVIVYELLQPYGTKHSLEELIAAAEKRNYQETFKRSGSATEPPSTTVHESLLYHLRRFIKAGLVEMVG
jgi:hypothetical protein